MMPIRSKVEIDFSDKHFSLKEAIDKLREEVQGTEKKWGIAWLKEGSNEDYFDVKIWLVKGKDYIIARTRLSDLYLVGFSKGTSKVWYTLADNSDTGPFTHICGRLKYKSIIHSSERGTYTEEWLPFHGAYVGHKSMGAAAGVVDSRVGRQDIVDALIKLFEFEIGVKDQSVFEGTAKGCVLLAILLCETMRFPYLMDMIHSKWGVKKGFIFTDKAKNLVSNWNAMSKYINKQGEEDYESLDQEWKDLLGEWGVSKFSQLCGLMKRDEKVAKEKGKAEPRYTQAQRAQAEKSSKK